MLVLQKLRLRVKNEKQILTLELRGTKPELDEMVRCVKEDMVLINHHAAQHETGDPPELGADEKFPPCCEETQKADPETMTDQELWRRMVKVDDEVRQAMGRADLEVVIQGSWYLREMALEADHRRELRETGDPPKTSK